jgi:hypothetical protein
LVLVFAVVVVLLQVYQYSLERWDDAYITFRYAQHLVEGYGFTWNIGGERVEGFTSLFHVLLIAAGIKAGIDPWLTSLILGVVSILATLGMMLLVVRRMSVYGSALATILIGLYLIDASTAIHVTSGLETQVFVALLCATYLTASAYIDSPRWSRSWLLGFLVFLSCLTRPEGLIYAVALYFGLGIFTVRSSRDVRRRLLQLAGSASLVGALGLGYVSWKYHYFGYILPNPYYVKSKEFYFAGWLQVGYFLAHVVLWFSPVVLTILVLLWFDRVPGLAGVARMRSLATGYLAELRDPKILGKTLITACPPLLALMYYMTILHEVGGAFRFSYPTYFYLVLAAGFLVSILLRNIRLTERRQVAVAVVVGTWIIAALTWQGSWRVRPRPLGEFAQYHLKIAEALKATGLRERGAVLCDAAGVIPYVSGFTQVDRVGLVDNFLSGRTPVTPEQRESYLWGKHVDVYVGYEPPAEPGRQRPEDDPRMVTPYVSDILIKRKLTLIEPRTFVQDPQLLHTRMRELRDNWELVGEVDWPGWRLWRLKSFVYVRRGSPHARALIARLKNIVAVEPHEIDLNDLKTPSVVHRQSEAKDIEASLR